MKEEPPKGDISSLLRDGFHDSSLPKIKTAFYVKDGKLHVIGEAHEDWTKATRTIATNYPPEMLLEHYAGFVPIKMDTEHWIEKPEFDTIYIAPEALDYVTIYDKNPNIDGEVTMLFDAYASENNYEIIGIPKELDGPEFVKVLLKPHTDTTDEYDGWYYFHRPRFVKMISDRKWASGYAICTSDYLDELEQRFTTAEIISDPSSTHIPDEEPL